ncbi:MAG: dihydropteroate synthase [Rikenellaceae bacterium]|nr:dihydropteroate synthase [Rikenellaceae bacterium]MCL2693166.1 dihydropteroate synthase [Rikenellaceae bacterium]
MTLKITNAAFDFSMPAVMAIINVTPDSFWEGSRRITDDDILRAIETAAEEGAAILDIGGYSSRPGAADVSADEEQRRVARGVRIARERFPQMAVSIDTFRSEVAQRIVEEFGAVIVNDISAGALDARMITTVAGLGLPYIAMHMRARPATMQQHTAYEDIAGEVRDYFTAKIAELRAAGIREIIIDPGFGFAKTTRQNYELLGAMDTLSALRCPLLAGVSRKSMIYKVLETSPEDALAGTAALHWEALHKGASILRAHDVREAVQVVRLFSYYKEVADEISGTPSAAGRLSGAKK